MVNLTGMILLAACLSNGDASEHRPVKVETPARVPVTRADTSINTIQGLSFSAPPSPVEQAVFDSIAAMGAEWVAVVPYAYGPGDNENLFWEGERWQYWGESEAGVTEQVRMARSAGLQVMLKPHLWLGHGEFTGNFVPADPDAFASSYLAYLITYARIAAREEVELLCIGTELRKFTEARPAFWTTLIDSVRSVYNGMLTYAANWDEVSHVPFWPALDLIGVDGYFPLTSAATSNVDTIAMGWTKHTAMLAELSQRHGRPILFTELGYTCTSNCTVEPWKEDRSAPRDDDAQAAAHKAFFGVLPGQPWYAGCFVWKWFADGGKHEMSANGFSPQGKAAERVLREEFGRE